jgi:pyridoxal phosphate enzyme (YggS family)
MNACTSTASDTIGQRLNRVLSDMRSAEVAWGRQPGSVSLLAVSKTHDMDAIRRCLAAGQTRFGENQVQEAVVKIDALRETPIEWHFIGAIQSNKTRKVAAQFQWVHSVDRFKIAKRLSDQRPDTLPPLNVCLEVNVSGEASKSGVTADALPALAAAVGGLPAIRLRGLMTVPAPAGDFDAQRRPFRQLRGLYEDLLARGHALDTLSMGMTADMEAAIAEGATIVRVGTAIFGPRRHT